MTMTNDRDIRLTAADRSVLREKIMDTGAEWHSLRRARNYSFSSMSKAEFFDACDALNIDVALTVRNAETLRERAMADAERDGVILAETVMDEDGAMRMETARHREVREARERIAARKEERIMNARTAEEFDRAVKAEEAAEVFADEADAPRAPRRDAVPADAASRLFQAIADIAGRSMDADAIKSLVRAEFEALARDNPMMATRIELTRDNVKVGEVDGHQHPEFAKLLRAATARDVNGYPVNVWIAGPAGSGKTHAVSMVAKALGIPFRFNGAIGMPHELLGFTDAGGNYHPTAFRKAYEDGGCYLFDEVDGSDNSALLALNAALANSSSTFPDMSIGRHKDCHIFAAANTWGHGATAEYVGRSKIDAAFLSRFPVRINWQYDTELEANICGNEKFARRVQKARAAAASAGLKVLITPRDSIAGAALIAAGFTSDEAAAMTYLASLTDAQRAMIDG